ncbi:MAG: HAD-IA family hydrolase [Lachnospiraceae bacterium]|nr:HAD-IA family hydrolase [Lachnospiraceae bacterium]
MAIKAILFDFDGVLTIDKTGSTTITNYISEKSGIPLDLIKSSYYKYNKGLLYGEITHEDMWNDFCDDIGDKLDYQILIDSFINTALDEKMIDLIKILKKNYLIGMVTDNKSDRIETILRSYNLKEYFDEVAVSAKVHSRKDSEDIFKYVLDSLKVKAEECIFIDNTAKNLIVPDNMGMQTILFDDEERAFDAFEEKILDMLDSNII